MMRNKVFILSIVGLFGVFSCKKYLDVKPTDFLSTVNYFNTEEELESARAGVYSVLNNTTMYRRYGLYLLAWDGDLLYGKAFTLIAPEYFQVNSGNNFMTAHWNTLWKGINRANVLLENVDKNKNISVNLRNKIRGEMLFLRGFFNFLLVQQWGPIPLKLSSTKSVSEVMIAPGSLADIYASITSDMKEAEDLVPGIREIGFGGFISKSAVRGILARVYLTMAGAPLNDHSQYQNARDAAKRVMDDMVAKHKLTPDFKDPFIALAQNKYLIDEVIWEEENYGTNLDDFGSYGNVGWLNGVASSSANKYNARVDAYMQITARYYNMFQDGDLRQWWSIGNYTVPPAPTEDLKGIFNPVNPPTGPNSEVLKWFKYPAKFRSQYLNNSSILTPTGTPIVNNDFNYPILRYADVLLMFAEADNAVNHGPTQEAIDAVNIVRERAWSSGVKKITLVNPGSNYDPQNPPKVTFSPGLKGKTAKGRAIINSNGTINRIELLKDSAAVTFWQEGSYDTPPTITVADNNGSGASATCTIYSKSEGDISLSQFSSEDDFLKFIQDERGRELGGEGTRKFDLLRWGIYLGTMYKLRDQIPSDFASATGTTQTRRRDDLLTVYNRIEDKFLLWPIPSDELQNNLLMKQNPGW